MKPFVVATPPEDDGFLSQLPSQIPSQIFSSSSRRPPTDNWGPSAQDFVVYNNLPMAPGGIYYEQQHQENYQKQFHPNEVVSHDLGNANWIGNQDFDNSGEERNEMHGILKPVSDIPSEYQSLFSHFPYFNIVQSTVFNDLFNSDRSIVVSAPTGSGKTVILELAILRLLMSCQRQNQRNAKMNLRPRVVYMAPMKALVSERYLDWQQRLGRIGVKCIEVTGDTDHDDITVIRNSQVVLTTPEKWDSLTRRWRDHAALIQAVALLLIDEVHVLNDEERGPTLEAVVSRMKTIQTTRPEDSTLNVRFVAVSATIPNVADVATWLSTKEDLAASYDLEESLRPVTLRRVVLGYECRESWSEFRFELSMNYKLSGVIATYSNNKPTLVFVATRKSAQTTASVLSQQARFVRDSKHKQILTSVANSFRDNKLRECVMYGIGYHHAGLEVPDRRQVEELFLSGHLPVIIATSTLAMGVNLPAHLVIIKSTAQYVGGSYQEYSASQILQMTGRAGRPQFDDNATAVIMTKMQLKVKYENLVNGRDVMESHLHLHLVEHLNAEIVLGTVTDLGVAVEWLRSTFFYVRVQHNPRHYGLPLKLDQRQLEAKLQDMCTREVNGLARVGLIELSEVDIKSTLPGRLMARYCVSFHTMKTFLKLQGDESLRELVEMVSSCSDFRDVKVRMSEKRVLNELNKNQKSCIRFPVSGKIKSREQKISCLIQAVFGCQTITDSGLNQESNKIMRTGQRLTKCLAEYSASRWEYELQLNSVLLHKNFSCRLWENSRYVTRQLQGIGPTFCSSLVQAKITSFTALENTTPRSIELILNRQPPFGNRIRDQASRLPRYELTLEQSNPVKDSDSDLRVTIRLANYAELKEAGRSSSTTNTSKQHCCRLVIGDADNAVVFQQRITDTALMVAGSVTRELTVSRASSGDELAINFISESWAGLDVQSTYTPRYQGSPPAGRVPPSPVPPSPLPCSSSRTPAGTPSSSSSSSAARLTPGYGSRSMCREEVTSASRRACLHTCSDKRTCAHNCCKNGVAARPISNTQGNNRNGANSNSISNSNKSAGTSTLPAYVQDIRKRSSQVLDPSGKKIKMTNNNGNLLSSFKFTPRPSMLLPKPIPRNVKEEFKRKGQFSGNDQRDNMKEHSLSMCNEISSGSPFAQRKLPGKFPNWDAQEVKNEDCGNYSAEFDEDFDIKLAEELEKNNDDQVEFPDMDVFAQVEDVEKCEDDFNDSLDISDIPDDIDDQSFNTSNSFKVPQSRQLSITLENNVSKSNMISRQASASVVRNSYNLSNQNEEQNRLNKNKKVVLNDQRKKPIGQSSLDRWLQNAKASGNSVDPPLSSNIHNNFSKPCPPVASCSSSVLSGSRQFSENSHQMRPSFVQRSNLSIKGPGFSQINLSQQHGPQRFQVPFTSMSRSVDNLTADAPKQRMMAHLKSVDNFTPIPVTTDLQFSAMNSWNTSMQPQDLPPSQADLYSQTLGTGNFISSENIQSIQTNSSTFLNPADVPSVSRFQFNVNNSNQMQNLTDMWERDTDHFESERKNTQSQDVHSVGPTIRQSSIPFPSRVSRNNTAENMQEDLPKAIMKDHAGDILSQNRSDNRFGSASIFSKDVGRRNLHSQIDPIGFFSSARENISFELLSQDKHRPIPGGRISKGNLQSYDKPVMGVRPLTSGCNDMANNQSKSKIDNFARLEEEFKASQQNRLSRNFHKPLAPKTTFGPHFSRPVDGSYKGDWQDLEMFQLSRQQEKHSLNSLYSGSGIEPGTSKETGNDKTLPKETQQHWEVQSKTSSQHKDQPLEPMPESQYQSIHIPSNTDMRHPLQFGGQSHPTDPRPWAQIPGQELLLRHQRMHVAQHGNSETPAAVRPTIQNPNIVSAPPIGPQFHITYGGSQAGVGGIQQNININLPSVMGSVPPIPVDPAPSDVKVSKNLPLRGILKSCSDNLFRNQGGIFDGIL